MTLNNSSVYDYLLTNHDYFKKLDKDNQQLFVSRVLKFINFKEFDGRQNLIVTNQMKVLIAASAVQVTLGLTTWELDHFKKILIYPSEYRNPQTNQLHKGETNLSGFMCFSWVDFMRGHNDPNDKIHLGLHEFTHALRFNGIKQTGEVDYFFDNYIYRWLACANKEFKRMQNNLSLFRKYGAVNINEFFSVAIETFFEAPLEFKNTFPELYNQTSILLNQTTNENGLVEIDCRNSLFENQKNETKITTNFEFKAGIKITKKIFQPALGLFFFTIILIASKGEAINYSLIGIIGCLIYLYFEVRNYVIVLNNNILKIHKKLFFVNKQKTISIPLKYLISIIGSQSSIKKGGVSYAKADFEITYLHENEFKTESASFLNNKEELDAFYVYLKKNNVHIFVKN